MTTLAEQAEGRTISISFYVRLVPVQVEKVGETDAAVAIGRGLILESMQLLKNAAEAEGFTVDIEVRQAVY